MKNFEEKTREIEQQLKDKKQTTVTPLVRVAEELTFTLKNAGSGDIEDEMIVQLKRECVDIAGESKFEEIYDNYKKLLKDEGNFDDFVKSIKVQLGKQAKRVER